MFLLSACDCGSSHVADAGEGDVIVDAADAGADVFDANAVDVGLPEVEPSVACADVDVPGGQACVDQGWFVLAKWSPLRVFADSDGSAPALVEHVDQSVYLDTFLMDETEVTNADYADAIAANPALFVPNCDGTTDSFFCIECEPAAVLPMRSSWNDETPGQPNEGVEDHPVRCIPKTAAELYCAARGGRLPTFYEWFKSAAGPHPASPSYPWGDELPMVDAPAAIYLAPAARLFASPPPEVGPVGTHPLNVSAYGILDLVGGVSELVSGCSSDFVDNQLPLVRPEVSATCDAGQLAAGSNWLTSAGAEFRQVSLAPSLFSSFSASTGWGYRYVGPPTHVMGRSSVHGGQGDLDEDARSWRVGFRCAYDVD